MADPIGEDGDTAGRRIAGQTSMPRVNAHVPALAVGTALSERTAERMDIVVTGHVDHGKSTVVGRLLADTHSLPEGKFEAVRRSCERNAKPLEYAFLLDALKDEQAQGITIDSARAFFKTPRRQYSVIDAPGHIEFLKNMISGASRAEAALLVIDAKEGVQENSRRHGFMLSMLGIRQIAVLVNKMDLVDYREDVFERLVTEYRSFLQRVGVEPSSFIPVSGSHGENLTSRAPALGWYHGPTVLESLDGFETCPPLPDAPFRMPVQGVYKFTERNDGRRIVAGTVESGRVRPGDEVVFYPSGKKSRVKSIEAFNRPLQNEAAAGQSTGFTLTEQIYVARGELAARSGEPKPHVTTRLKVSLFWLGKDPLATRREYVLKLGTARVPFRVEHIHRVIDASDLSGSAHAVRVQRHEVAECTLALGQPMAFDSVEQSPATGRFVVVDNLEIRGGGIVREALPDQQTWVRDKVLERNYKWIAGSVTSERRAERYGQTPLLLVITGERAAKRKELARALEARLFEDGRHVYFLGMGNILYGVDADIERTDENRHEHLRRLGEVAHILLDAGLLVVATAVSLTQTDLDIIRTAGGTDHVVSVWLGDRITTDLRCDLSLTELEAAAEGVAKLKTLLQDCGAIDRPW